MAPKQSERKKQQCSAQITRLAGEWAGENNAIEAQKR
jgi:hypothetical protein